ncbi:MAG: T9SS type A sorting domain-containing protein, partial [Flavobacteriales bacterium]|nr:T9SS type A sorting domain-containing protein [Flavobacteriales bacterium]
PVVFHVIHNYGAENISDAQIIDAIRVLNLNYRHQNPDSVDIVNVFKPLATDCEIELRLAQKDPAGNCTKGINRIASPLTFTGDHSVKDLIHWDPTKYLNVYIVANAAGLAGHAVWPSDADTIPEWDGIVIGHDYVGSIGTSNPVRSMVLSHELGHYLNLQHIWGGNNVPGFYYLPVAQPGNCAFDDGVSDTPNTIGWSTCNLSGSSCGNTVDNVQNFMDYSYCGRMFTPGQKTRMHACLNSGIAGRNNLWSPANLIATGTDGTSSLCAAEFSANKTIVCVNQSITFTDNSYHGVTQRNWTFSGGNASSLTDSVVTVSYAVPGTYTVSLSAGNGLSTVSTSITDYITVLPNPGNPGPLLESFDYTSGIPDNNWVINNPQQDAAFTLYTLGGYSGTQCVMFDNYNTNENLDDELISVPINTSGFPSLQLSFRYAFAKKDSLASTDFLKVWVSNDCGLSWTVRKTMNSSSLSSVAPQANPYFPSTQADWAYATVTNISNAYIGPDFMVKFVFTSGGGNNLFLDDINIAANVGTEDLSPDASLHIYPNPASNQVLIALPNNFNASVVELWSPDGKCILSTRVMPSNQVQLDLSSIAAGIYFLRVMNENSSLGGKILIEH